jgi:hypothetical protein
VVPFVAVARDFSLLANAQTESGTHTASHSMGTRGSFLTVNRPGRDFNHLSSSRTEDQNEWIYTYVGLQCINKENSASALCKLHQVEAAVTIFFLFSPPKVATFLCQLQSEISGKRGVLLALKKSSRIRKKLTWLYMASGNAVFAGMA